MIENPLTMYFVEHAGERCYISKKAAKERRNAVIRAEYEQLIVGRGSEEAIDIITRTHFVSESTVRRVLKGKK